MSPQPTRKDQAVALLELLLRKDNRAYISFYNSLVKETYDDLALLLHGDLPCSSPGANKNASDGCTPYGKREVGFTCATFGYINEANLLCERFMIILAVCPTVQTVLSEGGVPQRPLVFVSRPELVNQIREKLYSLQKEPGWITVFGMAGSGKSVLAAEAVRHHNLIEGDYIFDISGLL